MATFLLLLLAYGVLVEPRLILDVERFETPVPDLHPSWSGAEVAVFSDMQVGMWLANEGMVERVVEQVVEADPAAALILGDFVYSNDPSVAQQVDAAMELLEPLLQAGIPAYAVLGNHDYGVGAVEELQEALGNRDVEVLRNEAAVIPTPSGGEADPPLYVVGVGPAHLGRADVEAALEQVPAGAPRIAIMHNPTSFPEFPAGAAPIALAAHTHCGQVALPGTPRWSYVGLTQEEALVADGFAPPGYGAGDNRLFVTCGIGFSVVPIRINAAPQVVFVRLTHGG